jgi:hypothetical protein
MFVMVPVLSIEYVYYEKFTTSLVDPLYYGKGSLFM